MYITNFTHEIMEPVKLKRTLNLEETKIRSKEIPKYLLPKQIIKQVKTKNKAYKDYVKASIQSTIFLSDKWNQLTFQ